MKKIFYLLFGITLALGMASCGEEYPRGGGGGYNPGGGGGGQNNAYKFNANDLWAGYYGDMMGYGTGIYLVQLTDGTVNDDGDLTGAGSSIMLAISNQLLSNTSNLTLPEGTYKANGNNRNTFTIYNGTNSDDQYNSWLEVWVKGESGSEYYFIDSGTLTIKRTNGNRYSITADVDVFYYDNNGNTVDAGQVVATYEGAVAVDDMTSGGGGDSDTFTFTANDLWAGYYGDHLGFGTGVYLVQLTDGTVNDNGDLTGNGSSMMLAISNQLLANTNNLILPEGTYKANSNNTRAYTIYNGLNSEDQYNSWLEIWVKGEKQSEYYFIDNGTLTIERSSGSKYKITADVNVFYHDDNDNTVDAGRVVATYEGSVTVNDMTSGGGSTTNPYEPFTKNVSLGTMDDADCFFYKLTGSVLGNYMMYLYDVTFDKNDNVNSEGNIMVVDLYADYTDEPDLNQINGTYKVAEVEVFEENTFQPGVVYYDQNDKEYKWWGTYVDEIYKDGTSYYKGRCGLITDGTVNASHADGKLVLTLDLYTENGKRVTGEYRGIPNIYDEGDIEWSKARKVKTQDKYNLRPFSKFERRTIKKTNKAQRTSVNRRTVAAGNRMLSNQSRRAVSIRTATGNALTNIR